MAQSKREEALKGYKSVLSEEDYARLEFFAGLAQYQQELTDQVKDQIECTLPAAADLKKMYWSCEPILPQTNAKLPASVFASVAGNVAQYLAEHAGFEEELAQELTSFDWNSFIAVADVEQALTRPSDFLERTKDVRGEMNVGNKTPDDIIALVVGYSLNVVLTPITEQIRKDLDISDEMGNHDHPLTCPVCGSPATSAVVKEEQFLSGRGKKLYCALCSMDWDFERIRCARCGSFDQKSLHYYHVEGDAGHRIHSCQDCGSYTRTTFQDDTGIPLDYKIEDAVMARLDSVALQVAQQQTQE